MNMLDKQLKSARPERLTEKTGHYHALKSELLEKAEQKKPAPFFTVFKMGLSAALVLMVYVSVFGILDTDLARGEKTNKKVNTIVVAQEIDEQIMYPSAFVSPDSTFFELPEWTDVTVPKAWVDKGYYFEIWNGFNKPLSEFKAQRLQESVIDLSDVNAEDYGTLRFVLFVPEGEYFDESTISQKVAFHWNKGINVRLVGMMIMVFVILSVVTISAFIEKVTDKNVLHVLRGVLIGRETPSFVAAVYAKENQKRIATALAIAIMLLGGVFGAAVGSFMGNIHVVSVLIKFPILVLGTYLISSMVWYLFSARMTGSVTIMESILTVLLFLARFSLILVSTIPIVLFFIYTGIGHDGLLLLLLFLLTLSLLIASGYLFRIYTLLHQKKPSVLLITVWVMLYALIGLQLSWMLRPWVGLVGEYEQYIPFMRLYSGNVFEEIVILIIRIVTGNAY